jgi:hypothetical protein
MLDRRDQPPTDQDRRRRQRREQQRRHRQRERHGRMVVPVEIDGDVLGMLIKTGWLAERAAGDRGAVARALGRMLTDASAR